MKKKTCTFYRRRKICFSFHPINERTARFPVKRTIENEKKGSWHLLDNIHPPSTPVSVLTGIWLQLTSFPVGCTNR